MIKNYRPYFNLIFLSIVSCWWFFKFFWNIWTGVDGFGFVANKYCIEWTQDRGRYDFLNLKILCSHQSKISVQDSKAFLSVFKNLGLIHLLVASGTHLLLIKKGVQYLYSFFTTSKKPLLLTLLVFVLCSNFSGPVTRCFVQIIISNQSKRFSLNWSPINLTFLSSMIYLCFFPEAFLTLSFWLSLNASLILAYSSQNLLLLSLNFYLALLPFIIDFNFPELSSIVINILFTPIIAPIVILNSFLYVTLPYYPNFGDSLIDFILLVLKQFVFKTDNLENSIIKINLSFKIVYGLLLAFFALTLQYLRSKTLKKLLNINNHTQ